MAPLAGIFSMSLLSLTFPSASNSYSCSLTLRINPSSLKHWGTWRENATMEEGLPTIGIEECSVRCSMSFIRTLLSITNSSLWMFQTMRLWMRTWHILRPWISLSNCLHMILHKYLGSMKTQTLLKNWTKRTYFANVWLKLEKLREQSRIQVKKQLNRERRLKSQMKTLWTKFWMSYLKSLTSKQFNRTTL